MRGIKGYKNCVYFCQMILLFTQLKKMLTFKYNKHFILRWMNMKRWPTFGITCIFRDAQHSVCIFGRYFYVNRIGVPDFCFFVKPASIGFYHKTFLVRLWFGLYFLPNSKC